MQKLKIRIKGGEKASRNNSKCYSNQKLKEIQSVRNLSFSRKHLSLETAYTKSGISENLKNLLNVRTSGDVSISLGFKILGMIIVTGVYS